MELNYKVKIKQTPNVKLKRTLVNKAERLNLKVFKFDNNLMLKSSNSENISDYFKDSTSLVKSVKVREGSILGYEELEEDSYESEIDYDDDFFSNILDTKHRYNLIKVTNLTFQKDISQKDTVFLLDYDSDIGTFSIVDPLEYIIDYETSSIITTLPDSNYFLFVNKSKNKLSKVSSLLNIDTKELLNKDNGFYEILPTFFKKSTDFDIQLKDSNLSITSKEVLKLNSNLNISFDNCSTSTFDLIPNSKIDLRYTAEDLTPLNNMLDFNPEREYIVSELENSMYIPKYFLSSSVEDSGPLVDQFSLLIQSHEEFRKAYAIFSDEAELKILNSSDEILKTIQVTNKDFNNIKNDESFIDTLTKIKI